MNQSHFTEEFKVANDCVSGQIIEMILLMNEYHID